MSFVCLPAESCCLKDLENLQRRGCCLGLIYTTSQKAFGNYQPYNTSTRLWKPKFTTDSWPSGSCECESVYDIQKGTRAVDALRRVFATACEQGAL